MTDRAREYDDAVPGAPGWSRPPDASSNRVCTCVDAGYVIGSDPNCPRHAIPNRVCAFCGGEKDQNGVCIDCTKCDDPLCCKPDATSNRVRGYDLSDSGPCHHAFMDGFGAAQDGEDVAAAWAAFKAWVGSFEDADA